MIEEIIAYQNYLLSFGVVEKPPMPKFDVLAYTDNEYLSAIEQLMSDYDFIDDEHVTIKHLKGEWWTLIAATFIMQT